MANYQVIVSNVGTVHNGASFKQARKEYCSWVISAKQNFGRASGESVTLIKDGETIREHSAKQEPKYSLRYLDTCYPDYFQGFGGEVLAVYVSNKDRNADVLKALQSEISAWSGYADGEQAEDFAWDQLHHSAKLLFKDVDLRRTYDGSVGEEVYSYFGIVIQSE